MRRRDLSPGHRFLFETVLLGRACDYIQDLVEAICGVGRRGVGQGKGQFRLLGAEIVGVDGERASIDWRESDAAPVPGPLRATEILQGCESLEAGRVRLLFDTPIRLKYRGHFTDRPDFHILIRRLLQRFEELSRFHHGIPLKLEKKRLAAEAGRVQLVRCDCAWYDPERYSSRQQTRMKFGGLVGEVVYEGVLTPFMPLLILGQWTHVGKLTSFGLGKYRIMEVNN
ncbi:MAG: CRISPR system precrRNA processing endoribonuclease RAMP protein Cas6 [Acidobacteriota bacterium]